MTLNRSKTQLDRILGNLNGEQTLGRGRLFWLGFVVVVALLSFAPEFLSRYQIITYSNFLISGFLALSLCLLWGYTGILSLGQAAFFGIGGYAYGVIAINFIENHGNTNLALLGGILIPVIVAFIVGLVMFYARLKGVYVAILMLVVSLLMELFLLQTADPSYRIGMAALGGFNGLQSAGPDAPSLPNLILGLGESVMEFDGRNTTFYYLVLSTLVVVYLGLRWLVNSSYGYVMIGCREDLDRTESIGYDVRLIQLSVFCLAAAIAGLSGVFYTSWGTFVHPNSFGVSANILPVIWVSVGGRKDLTAALVGCLLLEWVSLQLASIGSYSMLVMGAIMVLVMLLAPRGLILQFGEWLQRRCIPKAKTNTYKIIDNQGDS